MAGTVPTYMRIRQYVISLSLKSGDKPQKIMPERRLAQMFGVTHMTVRKALRELVEEGYLYSVERKGVYTNPSNSSKRPTAYMGIISGKGKNVNYGYTERQIYSAVLKYLPPEAVSRFVFLGSSSGPEMAEEIKLYHLDGLIWISPCREARSAIKILRKSVPVTIIDLVDHNSYLPGSIVQDFQHKGRIVAEFFINNRRRKIVFCGEPGTSYRAFKAKLAENGIKHGNELVIKGFDEIRRRLPALIKTHRIDGIYSNGGSERIGPLFETLKEITGKSKFIVALDRCGDFNNKRKKHLGINIAAIFAPDPAAVGKAAVNKLMKMLAGTNGDKNEQLKQKIYINKEK